MGSTCHDARALLPARSHACCCAQSNSSSSHASETTKGWCLLLTGCTGHAGLLRLHSETRWNKGSRTCHQSRGSGSTAKKQLLHCWAVWGLGGPEQFLRKALPPEKSCSKITLLLRSSTQEKLVTLSLLWQPVLFGGLGCPILTETIVVVVANNTFKKVICPLQKRKTSTWLLLQSK